MKTQSNSFRSCSCLLNRLKADGMFRYFTNHNSKQNDPFSLEIRYFCHVCLCILHLKTIAYFVPLHGLVCKLNDGNTSLESKIYNDKKFKKVVRVVNHAVRQERVMIEIQLYMLFIYI